MEKIVIDTSTNSYEIIVGEGIYSNLNFYLKKDYSSILIVTDENVGKLYLEEIQKSLKGIPVYSHIVPSGEKSKSLECFHALQTTAIERGLDRNAVIIALGGGVVGDLAGFVAATFMRGVDFIQVPTTILAHDSSVGGKVAINHPLGKNLIGAFYPPVAVLYDISTLRSLSEKETRSGYAELVKEGLIKSQALFEKMISQNLTDLSNETLKQRILDGIKVKSEIVEADEKEHGVRSYLNLGHTFAHALEAELGYGEITHGEAVAIGILFSFHVSETVYDTRLPFEQLHTWMKENQYPINSISFHKENILEKMKSDKKAVQKQIKMVLLEAPGKLKLKEIPDDEMIVYLKTFERRLV